MAKKKLEGIIWPNLPNDEYYLDAEKVEYDNTENYPSGSVGKALNEKANVDGYYSNLTAGNAEQLVSNVRANDKTPYLFRTSGGSVDIGDREYVNGIVGGTIAWNQLVKPFNENWVVYSGTAADTTASKITVNGAVGRGGMRGNDVKMFQDHIYYVGFSYSATVSIEFNVIGTPRVICDANNTLTRKGYILKRTLADGTNRMDIFPSVSSATGNFTIENLQCVDLTQMFGSTIADYIYSLEQANAGAGVAVFRKLFPRPYYAYNAGELMSVNALRHDTVGFNQWDEEWEVGDISSVGVPISASDRIRAKNFIPVLPNTTYYVNSPTNVRIITYDSEQNFVEYFADGIKNATFTTDSNVHFIKFYAFPAYGTTYNNDICINLAWDNSRNGEYEPYVKHSYPLDSDLTLRGIPKLDANNNLYYDGDTYESDGTVTRKYGIVDLGSLTWAYTGTFFYSNVANLIGLPDSVYIQANILSAKYQTVTYAVGEQASIDKVIFLPASSSNYKYLYVRDTAYTDATVFATAMSGVYLVYELATPTTETADPYVSPQIVNDFGTEEFVIDSEIAVPIPVGHDTDYPIDMVAKLEMAPNSPDGNGDYIVRQTNGMNEYVPLVIEDALPTIPSTAGSYKLTVTVADGSDPVLSWEAE